MTATMTTTKERSTGPLEGEFAPYFGRYVGQVPAGDVVETLRTQFSGTTALLRGIDPARTTMGYAPGKWSIRDVVLHMADTERVMAYRALWIARGDTTPLPSFDENTFAPIAGANARSMDSLVDELEAVRRSTLAMFEGFPADAWSRQGTASGNPVTVRALAWIIAGHERHHVAIIRERYLKGDAR
jgi:DinB superfamily